MFFTSLAFFYIVIMRVYGKVWQEQHLGQQLTTGYSGYVV